MMEYLGIVWLTSWLMEFFASSNHLLSASEYLDYRSATKVLFVANNSAQKDHQSQQTKQQNKQKRDRQKASDETLTSINSEHSWLKPFLHSLQARKSANQEFCRPPEQITTETQLSSLLPVLVAPNSSSKSLHLISHKNDSTQTMLKWMDNILPFSTTAKSRIVAGSPAVQVVRVDETDSENESVESMYQLWVQGCLIGKMPHPISAYAIALQLQHFLQDPTFDPRQIQAKMIDGKPAVQGGSQLLFVVDQTLAEQLDRHPKVIALQWINNLRQALNTPPLTFAETQAQMYGLVDTGKIMTGLASWYGPYFHGRLTANGEIYNQYDLTAAHPSLPFDTYLKVTNLDNGKSVIVRINDRGPYIPPRSLDLSLGAARQLGSEHTGVVEYKAVIMKLETQPKPPLNRQVTQL